MPERPGATTIQVGSVLDDYQWHDLAVIRYMRNISVKIDQTIVREESVSAFNGLDLDGKVRNRCIFIPRGSVSLSFMWVEHRIIWNVVLVFDRISKAV